MGHTGSYGALYYHWKFDTEAFAHELQRVNVAAGLLFIAYTRYDCPTLFEHEITLNGDQVAREALALI